MHLNAKNVAALVLPGDRNDVIFFDDEMAGFGFRIRRKSSDAQVRATWIVQYRFGRSTRRVKIGNAGVVSRPVHNGRVIKRTRDGAIVEFRSVVDAVRCAVEVQNGMVERNAGLPPERRIQFRIGIRRRCGRGERRRSDGRRRQYRCAIGRYCCCHR